MKDAIWNIAHRFNRESYRLNGWVTCVNRHKSPAYQAQQDAEQEVIEQAKAERAQERATAKAEKEQANQVRLQALDKLNEVMRG